MRTRRPGKNRTKFLLLLLALLAAGGYATYRWNLSRQTGPGSYALAKAAYEKGKSAAASNDNAGAIVQLDEAAKFTEKALASIDTRKLPPKEAEARLQLQGELYWLKGKILRDHAFAAAAQAGKPIPETLDSSTGEKYRAYTAIPDLAARSAAVAMIRNASERIMDNPELILDALRIELVMQPMQWNRIERLCMMALKVKQDDARALYFLAKYEFDQPGSDGEAGSLTYENRDPSRIARAKEYMMAARAAGAPYWRSIHLEAEILQWLSRDARKRDPVRANVYREELRAKILGQPDGAMARAKRGDQWTNLSIHDVRAIAAIPPFALDLASDDLVQVRTVVQDSLTIFEKLAPVAGTPQAIAEAGDGIVETLMLAGVSLSRHDPSAWAAFLETAEQVFAKHPASLGRPKAALRFARNYAQLPGVDSSSRAADPRTVQLLNRALKAGTELRTPPAKQVELRMALLDALALQNASVSEIQAELNPLKQSDEPVAKAAVQFHEAALAERTGSLIAARKKYEPLVDNRASPELTARAIAALANITSDAEEYNVAHAYLRETENIFTKLDQYSPWDVAWLKRFAGSPEEVGLRQIVATYELGSARITHWLRANPGRLPPEELRQSVDSQAMPIARKLISPSDADRLARQARIRFLVLANQQTLAEKQFALLAVDYPRNPDLLATAAVVWGLPKPGESEPDAGSMAKIDGMLSEFLKNNPESAGAKAFQIHWLLKTGRRPEALAFLRSPAYFPTTVDPVLEAAVSGTLFGTDGLDDVSTILAALPSEPGVTAAILNGILVEGESSLGYRLRALERQRKVVTAWRQFFDGEYEPAAEGFLNVMDYPAVRPAARAGLSRCLLQYADMNPEKATAFLSRLQARYPEEPSIFLAAALAALRNEDLGDQTDAWGSSKSMWAALNRWQLIAQAYGVPLPTAAAIKMKFMLLAGRYEAAIQIPRQFNKTNPDDPALLLLLCEMHLAGPYRDLEAARKDLSRAFASVPDQADRFHHLEARLMIELGDFEAARKVCDLNVVNNPQSEVAFAQLIEVAMLQKDGPSAMNAAFRWTREQPSSTKAIVALIRQLYLNGAESAAKPAAEAFVNAAGLRGKSSATARVAVAEGFADVDDSETDRWLRMVLELDPADAHAQALAGMLAERRGDFVNALKHYEAALKAKPHDVAIAAKAMRILTVVNRNAEAACVLGYKTRMFPEGNRLLAAERLPAEFLRQWGTAVLASNNRERLAETRDGLLIGALRYPGDPMLLIVLAELQNALGEGARASENLTNAHKLAMDGKTILSPQDRRDTLDKVEAARRKIRE